MIKRLRQVLRIYSRLPQNQQVELADWVRDVLRNKVRNKKAVDEIAEKFEKGDETNMTYAIERVFDKVEARGKRVGARRGIQIGGGKESDG